MDFIAGQSLLLREIMGMAGEKSENIIEN